MRWTWSGVEYEWTLEEGIRWETPEGFDASWTLAEGIHLEMDGGEEGRLDIDWTLSKGVQIQGEGSDDDNSFSIRGSWRRSDGIRINGRINDHADRIHVSNFMILGVLIKQLWFFLTVVCVLVDTLLAGALVLASVFAELEHWWYHGATVFAVLSALYAWWVLFLHDEAVVREGIRHPRWYGRLLLSWPVVMSQVVMATLVYKTGQYALADVEIATFSLHWFGVLAALIVLNTPVFAACSMRISIAMLRILERPVLLKIKGFSEVAEALGVDLSTLK